MNLIVIYGAPAAGKLTVSRQLARMTGYKLFDNHAIVTPLAEIFSYSDPKLNDIRAKLGTRIKLEVIKEAAAAGISLIITSAAPGEMRHVFFRNITKNVEEHGGKVLFVQLVPSAKKLHERVVSESRRNAKIDNSKQLEALLSEHPDVLETFPDVPHLIIDNSDLSPEEVAEQIVEHYSIDVDK